MDGRADVGVVWFIWSGKAEHKPKALADKPTTPTGMNHGRFPTFPCYETDAASTGLKYSDWQYSRIEFNDRRVTGEVQGYSRLPSSHVGDTALH